MKPNRKFLLVTTGDFDGIGYEVSAKSLCQLTTKFFESTSVCVFISKDHQKKYTSFLEKHFSVEKISCDSKKFSLTLLVTQKKMKKPQLFLVMASDAPPDWIFYLSKLCAQNPSSVALVTGPLSKTLIKDCGYKAIGHTEIMSQATGAASLFMGFLGKYFNVVLLTGHIPLSRVSSELKTLNWPLVFSQVETLGRRLKLGRRPMALLGVNPHGGEKGMISTGEEDFLQKNLSGFENRIHGPLVPDAAFLKQNWKKYSFYLATYHDQGLIPFKTVHGQDSGVHITVGLPFVRTSVDHGTAKEIFGKNVANPNSMKEALVLAQRLLT